ncbi:unnamed protein product [Cylicocyclus nassatus]|uniref:Lipoprotein LpqB C-terminal domain-containing protein n=1 Tax=Cylicocyclus nassatus TaxID=53992 RepID=A0AA36HGA6_CYLNA|nr:unnamed protein product [Cylicocyclus nassatus]
MSVTSDIFFIPNCLTSKIPLDERQNELIAIIMAASSMSLPSPKSKRPRIVQEKSKTLPDEEEEDRLARKLFGDNRDNLKESSDDEEDTVPRTSVWHDEDEDDEVDASRLSIYTQKAVLSTGSLSGEEYRNRLRKAFQRQHGTPKWARLEKEVEKRTGDEAEDEVNEVFNDMTRSVKKYIGKDPFLVKDILSSFRWPDVTIGYHDNRPINVVLFHNVRPVVMTTGSSGKVQLFKVGDVSDGGNFLQNVQFSNFPVTSMSMINNGCALLCGSLRQDYFMKYDLEKGSVMQLNLPKCIPRQNAGRFAVSYDGSLVAMIAHNSQVLVFSSSSMELVRTLSASAEVTSLQFLPDSNRELWALTEGSEVIIWSLQGSQHVFHDDGGVRGTKIRLSGDGSRVACGSTTGIVNVYDVMDVRKDKNPKPRTVVSNLVTSCDSIAFNHDSQIMAFSSNAKQNQVRLLHVATGTTFSNFPKKHEKMTNVECVEFSPHSAYLGIGCANGQLILERLNHFEDY